MTAIPFISSPKETLTNLCCGRSGHRLPLEYRRPPEAAGCWCSLALSAGPMNRSALCESTDPHVLHLCGLQYTRLHLNIYLKDQNHETPWKEESRIELELPGRWPVLDGAEAFGEGLGHEELGWGTRSKQGGWMEGCSTHPSLCQSL